MDLFDLDSQGPEEFRVNKWITYLKMSIPVA